MLPVPVGVLVGRLRWSWGARVSLLLVLQPLKVGLKKISATFAEADVRGCGMALNVTSADDCVAVVKAVTEEFGAPQILVNNAGITRDNILMRMKDDEWESVINTNLNAIYRMSKAVLRGMTKARWGRIINISSVVGSMGNGGQSNYCGHQSGG